MYSGSPHPEKCHLFHCAIQSRGASQSPSSLVVKTTGVSPALHPQSLHYPQPSSLHQMLWGLANKKAAQLRCAPSARSHGAGEEQGPQP